MKKRDVFLITVIIIVIAVLLGLSFRLGSTAGGLQKLDEHGGVSLATLQPSYGGETPAPTGYSSEKSAEEVSPTLSPADAYLKITVDQSVSNPIPLTEETEFRLSQANGSENVVHVTKDAIWMSSANCADQSCVDQGTVSLKNRDSRLLKNMIICLPHGVTLQLLTPEEAQAEWEYWYGSQSE